VTHHRFSIVFVCTGNICRSPAAQLLTRHLLDKKLNLADARRFTVSSAATDGPTGARMHPLSGAELAPWGLADAVCAFRSRRLDSATVTGADLVLTAERRHRRQVVELRPDLLGKTFCLREMARLLDGAAPPPVTMDPVGRARFLVAAARQRRGASHYVTAADDGIPDPIGLPLGAHRVAVTAIAETVNVFVGLLGEIEPPG